MYKPVLVSMVLAFMVAHAASQTVIKGHHVGETVQEFLQASPDMKDQLATCHSGEPKPITPEQVHALSNDQVYVLSLDHQAGLNRKQLEQMARDGKLFTKDERGFVVLNFCKFVVDVLEKGIAGPITQTPYSSTPMWGFTDGRLSSMSISLPTGSFAEVEADLTKRIGVQPVETSPSYSNGYGATWHNEIASWLSQELTATLEEDHNPVKPSLMLSVTSRSLYDAFVKAKAAAPSPLD